MWEECLRTKQVKLLVSTQNIYDPLTRMNLESRVSSLIGCRKKRAVETSCNAGVMAFRRMFVLWYICIRYFKTAKYDKDNIISTVMCCFIACSYVK